MEDSTYIFQRLCYRSDCKTYLSMVSLAKRVLKLPATGNGVSFNQWEVHVLEGLFIFKKSKRNCHKISRKSLFFT